MEQLNSKQIKLLEVLGDKFNVLCIIDPSKNVNIDFYVFTEFREATGSNPFISIRGFKRITDIVDSNSVYVNNQGSLEVIVNQINDIPVINRERKFSSQFQWIKF